MYNSEGAIMNITLNKTYNFTIQNFSFGNLSKDEMIDVLVDGRFNSPFMERQLTKWFPQLKHITGNKDHDHVDGEGNLYDAKNFTKNGLKFKPSNQLGQGRSFNKEVAHEKANKLIYICCDIIDFPKVKVKFIDGGDLVKRYPLCEVPKSHRTVLF
jgi:hypothetical protein